MSTYTKEYFIAKFEAIPEELWASGSSGHEDGKKCAVLLCDGVNGGSQFPGMRPEGDALHALFPHSYADETVCNSITRINDGRNPRYQQPTPKARVIAALRDLPLIRPAK